MMNWVKEYFSKLSFQTATINGASSIEEHRKFTMKEEEEGDEGFPGRLLHQAALWGNAELLEDLLHGEQVDYLDVIDPLGRTALHAAATNENETCARILLQAGANPNIACGQRGFNKTPLHVAAENGHVAIVQLLIDYQADLLAKESNGFTAMDLAEQCGHPQVMEVLRRAADEQEQRRHDLYQALANACANGEVSQAKQIIKQLGKEAEVIVNTTPNGCNTLLFKACEDGQKEIVKVLLDCGADGRIHPVTKYSPLYIACYNGRKDIVEILLKKFPELVQVSTVEKWLPIHAAAISGHLHVLDLLLKFPYPPHVMQTFADKTKNWEYSMPFDINAKDVTEQSVLYLACLVGNQRLLELLLKFRVRATKKVKSDDESEGNESNGKSNLDKKCNGYESLLSPKRKTNGLHTLMSKLNLRNEQPPQKIESNISPLDLDLYCNNCTETALHVAVKKKHYTLASLLLQNGANVNLRTSMSEEDMNRFDDDCIYSGSTALVEACRNRDSSLVELLIRYGARDDECQALQIAAANKDEHLMSRLLALKAHSDPEYKINKKALEFSPGSQFGSFIGNVTFSSMFPTVPVMINWHGQHCLEYIREQWLIDASVSHNIKLKLTPRNQTVALLAITRLDVSNNQLTELPLCVFQMHSLKVLNAAQNKIECLPENISHPTTPTRNSKSSPGGKPSSGWTCPYLEEIHLQDNRLDSVPSCIFQLPQLWFLDLSNNKLQSLPYNMWTAPKLRELNLALNILHDLPTHPSRVRSASSMSDFSLSSKDGSEECLTISTESSPRHSVTDSTSIGGNSSVSFELRCLSPPFPLNESVQDAYGGNILRHDLQHHNYWSRNVVEVPLDSDIDKKQQCQLVSLNLAHNAYECVPPMLACLAVNLARLNLSYNYLTAMGSVQLYPANIKHLDLSHNRIKSWPTRRFEPDVSSEGAADVLCYGQTEGSASTKSTVKNLSAPGVRKSPRILHSGWGSNSNIAACVHRHHSRLDNLRTLILADNELDKLTLTVEDDSLVEDEDDRSSDSADLGSGPHTGKGDTPSRCRSRILFPNLSMLDVSNNAIKDVPSVISELCNLSVLNLSGNYEICHLPPEMGLLNKLWNLNTRGCNLNEPLKSMIESKKYKTMDIIGYLKSILEDAKIYARMKLMIVGVQGIGKTSLLEQLRQEGTGMYRKKPPEHWGKRMGNKNINLKTPKGVSISTVGVDVGDWTYEKKVRGHPSFGPVTFRTWDFGGQKEYYATHQYFLSKRSLYLVVWKMIDGERGVDGILQWLVNIQARAPNAPVIIVGTHYDLIKENFSPSIAEELQHLIRERFINVVDADKCGLPRVLDSVQISCKTRHNIKHLCNLIYDSVFDLRCPGSKERFLEQKIPATYLALEDVVTYLSFERRLQGKDPVLRAEQYKTLVMHEMQQRFNITFRDIAELNQATTFLHENGVLLHYEDATLKDLYFLDPQWLCDMLAHVVTIREINPFARNGIMKIDDLKHVFKSSQCAPADAQAYILNLLNKFEVALTWDNRTLLIPSLLPTEEQLRAGLPGCDVRIPVRSRSWALRKTFGAAKVTSVPTSFPLNLNVETKRLQQPPCPLSIDIISSPKMSGPFTSEGNDNITLTPTYLINHETNQEASIRRLLLMSYFPSGFWSRLMTRILADDFVIEIIRSYFVVPKESQSDPVILSVLNCKAEWICWQTGMELRYIDTTLFRVKELLPYLDNSPCDYRNMRFLLQQEGSWTDVQINNSSILEIFLPNQKVVVQKLPNGYLHAISVRDSSKKCTNIVLEPSKECTAKLLALTVDHIDTLLEDWYPTLGTRFVHTSEGKFLVTRLIPCTPCLVSHLKSDSFNDDVNSHLIDQYCDKESWQIVDVSSKNGLDTCISKTISVGGSSLSTTSSSGRFSDQGRTGSMSPKLKKNGGSHGSSMSHDSDSGVGPDSNSSSRKPSAEGRSDGENAEGHDEGGDASQASGDVPPEFLVYSFMVEECILSAYELKSVKCPLHNELSLSQIAPDTVFMDLGERFLIKADTVRRGKMLGRGAFGFVFKATCKQRGSSTYIDVAMKMLQPVDPGFGARQSDTVAYKAAWSKWQRDPLQYACKAYCTARQELNILLSLRHQHIVPLVGVCTHPLSLVLHLAPQGALDCVLKNYRRSGAQLDLFVLQKIVIQIAKALEYLHQQHIIYRDLKSENVLVWELPPPFHPSLPHPAVEVKLADYGISRSTLPTGAKGFGGTEGFMAPEIMRYNGEEEYTEKVDCFSFGMFMYELITLHLPFEGQECVKDHILDGGRPSLTPREMLYPTYILDLMTLCWSQQPKDRPSASQIVSIATAPEFVHLVDVVSLHDHMAVLSAGVAEVNLNVEDESSSFPLWEVWLGRLGKQMDILSCNQHGWQEYKTLTVENVTITSLCIVEETIWLGDSRATVHVYSASQYTEMFCFRLDPDSGSPSAIRGMCYVPNLGCIAMATSSGRLWLCDSVQKTKEVFEELSKVESKEYESLTDLEELGIRELSSNGAPILSIASLMTSTKSCELWCGQTQGSINIFTLQDMVVTAQVVVNHYEPVMDNLDVFQLAAGSKETPYVWSYLYPGCVVHQWDAANRTILNKLDCSKLAPCSESLMSISIEEHLSPGRCQVTAMAALGSELYIGTTWGCIVVAEGSTMRPVTVFRPFEEEVKAILPISASTEPLASKETKVENANPTRSKQASPPTIITVGKGYRNLIARYVLLHGSETAQRSMYLMVWRAENWSSS